MTRIISGRAGGLRLRVPSGPDTRPTSDRVREALFSRLEHLDVLAGARVLDLYAGSGALGLEAASRGAADVVLVESGRAAAAACRANAAAVAGATGVEIRVRAEDVPRALAAGAGGGRRDLVFLDPPYAVGEDALADVLALLVAHDWLAAGAVVVVERSSRSPQPRWPVGVRLDDERRYGDTVVWSAEVADPDLPA